MAVDLDISRIRAWRSIVTLVVFVFTNIVVLFPFSIPIYVPQSLSNVSLGALSALRIIAPRQEHPENGSTKNSPKDSQEAKARRNFVRLELPMNFVTAPLIADLFLLAISAIGRKEVYDGTIGTDNISPLSIMIFFITLAYIAISIDASGLIRWLAFKVLQKAGKVGHRLFFYLYAFFFSLGVFIGNDPIILSGTAFLAYMTRVSNNIEHPRAWIHAQFAIANIASAVLVSSNPTNLVLAGAFQIKFVDYTANMVVPVVITAIVLFPFLLYIVFANESLIPLSIKMEELPEEVKATWTKPVNPNIPHARGVREDDQNSSEDNEQVKLLQLEEVLNPFLDKGGAAFGAFIMAATLITLLVLNAVDQSSGEKPVYWVTLPAAFVMFCWDVAFGWIHRHETRSISRQGRKQAEAARAERVDRDAGSQHSCSPVTPLPQSTGSNNRNPQDDLPPTLDSAIETTAASRRHRSESPRPVLSLTSPQFKRPVLPSTLVSLVSDGYLWLQETFPTVTAVLAHLPFALVPFAFCMFILVQALVTKGWVPVFAYGWDGWVHKTGTVGSIGGMGFLSVILCNFAGTNIGTTILLSRVIQAWAQIHADSGAPISDRTFWATVYGMALGVNYGAFSTAFSASLAGLLWRDILARKHIRVGRLEFARVNLPIIAMAMSVGCAVLVGEIYIVRDDSPYSL